MATWRTHSGELPEHPLELKKKLDAKKEADEAAKAKSDAASKVKADADAKAKADADAKAKAAQAK